VFGRAPSSSGFNKTAPLHFFLAKHPSSKNSKSTKSMDLAPNSTKSMECLKGYSAKAGFVLTRGVGWKLPTFATHYNGTGSSVFVSPFPLATFPVARRSPRQTASPPLRVFPNAASCPLGNDEMSRPPALPRFRMVLRAVLVHARERQGTSRRVAACGAEPAVKRPHHQFQNDLIRSFCIDSCKDMC
jgi:hypothetical protein